MKSEWNHRMNKRNRPSIATISIIHWLCCWWHYHFSISLFLCCVDFISLFFNDFAYNGHWMHFHVSFFFCRWFYLIVRLSCDVFPCIFGRRLSIFNRSACCCRMFFFVTVCRVGSFECMWKMIHLKCVLTNYSIFDIFIYVKNGFSALPTSECAQIQNIVTECSVSLLCGILSSTDLLFAS